MTVIGFEIDFLPVGEESKSGDAILFRYKEEYDKQKIILIDGGHKESKNVKTSDTILNHMRRCYYPNSRAEMHIDHIVCSHPDKDHIGGLQGVMEQCSVGTFWINNPLDYVNYSEFEDGSGDEKFYKSHVDRVEQLIGIADQKNISVKSPLQGESIGPLVVCSPSAEFYKDLVRGELTRQLGGKNKFMQTLVEAAKRTKIIKWVRAEWGKDDLEDYPVTSVRNESSTVLFGNLMNGEYKFLLTADAGVEALSRSYGYLKDIHGYISGSMKFVQMPHHGSRRNVNTKVLDHILGNKILRGSSERGYSFASVAKESEDYPRKAVINAFSTRGFVCSSTAGRNIWYRENLPGRYDDGPIPCIPYSDEVEALDE